MQVTGETIHKTVWVQLWLASFKARKSWHKLAGLIVSQHKREWETDLDSTKACLMRVITAFSVALDQLHRPWPLGFDPVVCFEGTAASCLGRHP
eukprot:2657999-Amphidinium_carterae.5